jgi:hypothetical protein
VASAHILGATTSTQFNGTDCLYFTCDEPFELFDKPYLIINANTDELIDHLLVLSACVPSYAPKGKTLISVSLVNKPFTSVENMEKAVERELTKWFGNSNKWKHLRTYHNPQALTNFTESQARKPKLQLSENLNRCGDYLAYPSLNAAMKTGREVAEMIAQNRFS